MSRRSAHFGVLRFPAQVLFGAGTAGLVGDVAATYGSRAFVCLDPNLPAASAAVVLESLQPRSVKATVFRWIPSGSLHSPAGASTVALVADAVRVAAPVQPDVIIAVGGGTTIDLGKLVGVSLAWPGSLADYYDERGVPGPCVPLIAVPTTAGTGSEVSPNAIVSDPSLAFKAVVGSPYLIPAASICDPDLTMSCPSAVTAYAGMDALVNAVESYTTPWRLTAPRELMEWVFVGNSILTESLALQAVGLIGGSLVAAVTTGTDRTARSDLLLGCVIAALAYSQSGTGGVHALAYPIEAAAHVPHGLAVGLLLPYVMEYNKPASRTGSTGWRLWWECQTARMRRSTQTG